MRKPKRTVYIVHYVRSDKMWIVKVADTSGYLWQSAIKRSAVCEARFLARANMPSQIRVKGKNGKIQTEWTYGSDPRKTKG